MKFLAFYWEMLEVKYGVWGKVRAMWGSFREFMGAIWVGLHILIFDPLKGYGRKCGRFWARSLRGYGRRNGYKFSWWTYYKAVTWNLRMSRIAKSLWGGSYIDAETCCLTYDRYHGIQKRALEKGYVRLASQDIHAKRKSVMNGYWYANFLRDGKA